MKIRPLFEKYQKYLLAFANTYIGRQYLSLWKWAKIKNNYKIIKVAPDGIHWWTGEFNKKGLPICQAVFFSKSPYLKKFRLALEGLEISSNVIGKIYQPDLVIPHFQGLIAPKAWLPLVMRDSGTFYPDADPESTSVDGRASRASVDETWSSIRGGAGNDSQDSTATATTITNISTSTTTNQYDNLNRAILLFDTSSISNASVQSATFSQYITSVGDYLAQDVSLVTSTPASNTAIVDADYGVLGTIQLASDLDLGSISTSAYNDWSINATGLTKIGGQITKYGLRLSGDRSNTEPSWSSAVTATIVGYFADYGSNKPKLVVIYSSGSLFMSQL